VAVPPNGLWVRVGPFHWTPQMQGDGCLLAVVKDSPNSTIDPTIADSVKAVDYLKLVQFDNNVAKRTVEPPL
jgi:hypothetical protein